MAARPAAVAANDTLGFVFVNGMGYNASDSRYSQATDAGAAWTRWPMYWSQIETSPGSLGDAAYASVDTVVDRDRARGLQINAILLGTPSWSSSAGSAEIAMPQIGTRAVPLWYGQTLAQTSAATSTPMNLYRPVFNSDGSINQSNYWARFVYTTVNRYKDRIKHWEMWNEGDLSLFWTGSNGDYKQLLKVGYLAAKRADPTATVLMSGLAYWEDPGFLPDVLDRILADGDAAANNHFFDVVPWHFYVNPEHNYNYPVWARTEMAARGLSKAVWVNETNVPACGDSQVSQPISCRMPREWRGTQGEQASFIIQAIALARAAGVERIFGFQLVDDFLDVDGNVDWYGYVRNNGTRRPAWDAYRTAAEYLLPASTVQRFTTDTMDRVVFQGTAAGKVTVVWNRTPTTRTESVPATTAEATRVDKAGATATVSASGGAYSLTLPGATYLDWVSGGWDIGGDPYILVEAVQSSPTSRVDSLPSYTTGRSFPVRWRRTDTLPVAARFDVQYRVGEGSWTDWVTNVSSTEATFGPASPVAVQEGNTYYFRSRARDNDGHVEPWPSGGCACDASIGVAYSLSGRVTNSRGSAVAGAQLQAGAAFTTLSGLNGDYQMSVYPGGAYALSAHRSGYGLIPERNISLGSSLVYTWYVPPSANSVQNWGFEGNGGVGEWWSPGGNTTTSTSYVHSGGKAAKLGDTGYVGDSTLAQGGLSVAAGAAPPLAFIYSVLGTPVAADRFTVEITEGSQSRTVTVPIGASLPWRLFWTDLTGFGNVGVTLRFHQEGGSTARLFVDEASVGEATSQTVYRTYLPVATKSAPGGW